MCEKMLFLQVTFQILKKGPPKKQKKGGKGCHEAEKAQSC
jgi:hypothetical protein